MSDMMQASVEWYPPRATPRGHANNAAAPKKASPDNWFGGARRLKMAACETCGVLGCTFSGREER